MERDVPHVFPTSTDIPRNVNGNNVVHNIANCRLFEMPLIRHISLWKYEHLERDVPRAFPVRAGVPRNLK